MSKMDLRNHKKVFRKGLTTEQNHGIIYRR